MRYVIEIYKLDVINEEFTRLASITTFQNLSFYNKLNGIGGASFQLNVFDPVASQEILTRYRNQVVIKREGVIVWFGPITNVFCTFNDVHGFVIVDCQSYFSHLKQRQTAKLVTYTGIAQGTIAWTLINTTQTLTNGTLLITQGLTTTGTLRDRGYEYKNIADAITDLSNVIGGIEFDFTPLQGGDGRLTGVEFNTYNPRIGSLRTDLNPISISNTKKVSLKTDNTIINTITGEGAGTGESVFVETQSNTTSQTDYTRREDILSVKDVSIPTTLSNKITADLNKYSVEQYILDIELYPDVEPVYGSYILGDSLKVDIALVNNMGVESQYVKFKGEARIIELAVDIDSNGKESITPKLLLS